MVIRYSLAAITTVVALTGCVKQQTAESPTPDFTTGSTLVTVTHVPARTADGATVFVTVDGDDAGALPIGESMDLHVPAGSHQVGGYARSFIGRVTIPAVQVTTTPAAPKHIAYLVNKSKPTFLETSQPAQPEFRTAEAPQG